MSDHTERTNGSDLTCCGPGFASPAEAMMAPREKLLYTVALYIGTGIQNGGFDRVNSVGPAAAEVLRIWPDDSFDLLCGDPRMTPWGFKVPLSGLGPGFDNPFAGYMWRCGIHDGAVYFGNYDSTTFVQYAILDAKINRLLPPDVIDRFLDFRGGFDVWRSVDGTRWAPLTRNGFGNRFNFGVRTILGTPKGLFIGGANPFGPRVAVRHADGYRYEDNTRGGCDIFYGYDKHPVEDLHGAEHAVARLARAALDTARAAVESDQGVERRMEEDAVVDVSASPVFGR